MSLDFSGIAPLGLENQITNCLRVSVNWKCHFKCNYCYVPPLIEHRHNALNVHDTVLGENDWRPFIREMFRYYQHIHGDLTALPMFPPLSFCAADPPRDIDAQLALYQIYREELQNFGVSEQEIYNKTPSTIILDLHREHSVERFQKLVKRVADVWPGLVWFASTLWIFDNNLRDEELQIHLEAKRFCEQHQKLFCSILTPSTTTKESRVWQDYLPNVQRAHNYLVDIRQYMATINIAVPLIDGYNGVTYADLGESLTTTFIEFFEAFSRYWLASVAKTFYDTNLDDTLLDGIIESDAHMDRNNVPYYLVCETGLVPGLTKILNTRQSTAYLAPWNFGCFPGMNCYNGILGIEPGGVISACQFGHDPLTTRARELTDFDTEVVRSPERLRNLREKSIYPFLEKSYSNCQYGSKCEEQLCGSLYRGSCPVDLYFQDVSYTEPAYTCGPLVEANRRFYDAALKLPVHPMEVFKKVFTDAGNGINAYATDLLAGRYA